MTNSIEIKGLVINIDPSSERWQFQQLQLKHLSIKHERFAGTSIIDITDEEYEKWSNDWQRKLRRTEVGCFLSHYRIWQHIYHTQETTLVLEDDALLSEDLPKFLNKISSEENLEYDYINLETRGRKKLISKTTEYKIENTKLHHLYLDKSGSAAYILTPIGAKKLLQQVAKVGAGLADAAIVHTDTLVKLQALPALSIQMDMIHHYGMDELDFETASKSIISTTSNTKPKPNSFTDKFTFKLRRLNAQLDMGLIQLKNFNNSNYLNIRPNRKDFSYLLSFIKK